MKFRHFRSYRQIPQRQEDRECLRRRLDFLSVRYFADEVRELTNSDFCADHLFTKTSNTKEIYLKTCQRIIESVKEGYNGTIFAYGQTTAGKTHTMLGTAQEPGIV